MIRAAQAAADADPQLGAAPHRGRGFSGALAARRAGWPALVIGCVDEHGLAARARRSDDLPEHVDPAAIRRAVELAAATIRRLDAGLRRAHDATP